MPRFGITSFCGETSRLVVLGVVGVSLLLGVSCSHEMYSADPTPTDAAIEKGIGGDANLELSIQDGQATDGPLDQGSTDSTCHTTATNLSWSVDETIDPTASMNILAIAGRSSADMYMAGDEGHVFRNATGHWTHSTPIVASTVRSLWVGPGMVFAAGGDEDTVGKGGVAHFDGHVWTPVSKRPGKPTENLRIMYDIWGISDDDVYAVGKTDFLHFDGEAWKSLELPPGSAGDMHAVWGDSSVLYVAAGTDIWAYRPGMGKFDSSPMTKDKSDVITDIWGISTTQVFAVAGSESGSENTVLHSDGVSWTGDGKPAGNVSLRTIRGVSSTDIYAVGDSSTVVHYDGFGWTVVEKKDLPTVENLPLRGLWIDPQGPGVYTAGRSQSVWVLNRCP
jgi:hypothetical protein